MKCQQVLIVLSTIFIVSNCEEGCGSAENPKKIPGTVQDHLKNTVRTLWQEEILSEQTNDIKVVLNNALVERDSKIEAIEGQLVERDSKIEAIEGQLAQKDQQINQLTNKVNE